MIFVGAAAFLPAVVGAVALLQPDNEEKATEKTMNNPIFVKRNFIEHE